MANTLTGIRIICGLLILAVPAFSIPFYLCYVLGGVTDAIDGTVARKLGKATAFGAKFDTAADIVFVLAVVIKVVFAVYFPLWLVIWIIGIAAIKFANVIIGFRKYHSFVAVHSVINKVCGVIVFLVPLYIALDITWQPKAVTLILTCALATGAAIDEFGKIKTGNQYRKDK